MTARPSSDVERERLPGEPSAGLYPAILTVDEFAELMRVNRKTAYAAINAGEIPGVRRIGNTIRLHRDTVLAWLSEGQARVPRPRRKP